MTSDNIFYMFLTILCFLSIYAYEVVVFVYANNILKRKYSLKVIYGIIPSIILLVVYVLISLKVHLVLIYVSLVVILMTTLLLCFKTTILHVYWASLNFIFHLVSIYGIVMGFYAVFVQKSMHEILRDENSCLISLIITMLFLAFFLYLFNENTDVNKVKILLKSNEQIRFVYTAETVIFIFSLVCTYIYYVDFGIIWLNAFHIIISTMTLLSFYIIFNFSIKASIWKVEEQENEVAKKNMYLQLLRNEEKQKMYATIQKYNHDVKNLIYSANILLCDNNYTELKKLLSVTEKEVNRNSSRIVTYSNDGLLDSILYELSLRCKKETIEFNSVCPKPDDLVIDDIDFSRIINNLCDNAVEACLKVEEGKRFIDIKSTSNANLFTLVVKNSFNKECINFSNNTFKTTKENKENHGIGITNIKEIVAKYDGETKIIADEESGVFSFYIILTLSN